MPVNLLRNTITLFQNSLSRIFSLVWLLVISLSLSSCETLFGTYTGGDSNKKQEARQLITLGDIATRPAPIQRVQIKNITAADTIESYQGVLDNTDEPEILSEAGRRIADLSLIATEDRLIEQADLADKIDALSSEINKLQAGAPKQTAIPASNVDEVLIAEEVPAISPENQRKIIAHQTEIAQLEEQIAELARLNSESYRKAIQIYEQILEIQPDGEGNDQILYQLAAAYDMEGNDKKLLDTLDRLAKNYPASDYYTETEFRRAEMYFSSADYLTAAEAYQAVQKSEKDSRFNDHALYKHGWSLFKTNDYELAINDFIVLRDRLDTRIAAAQKQRRRYDSASDEKLILDTNHVIALSFSHLSGPDALKTYFASIGGRHYEVDIYKDLYANYIHQERYRDAANTYDTFLEIYPMHKEAPKMQSAILQAYHDGGFPSLVLPGKIAYVKRFGIHSEFWQLFVAENATQQVYTPEEKEEVLTEVKKHLADVSKHYHSIAQRSKKTGDYQVAAVWYREYLDTFSSKDGVDTLETLEIRRLLAESLYESKQYELAVIEFEKLARTSGENKEAGANASYFALLSYQQMLTAYKGEEAGKNELIAKKVASSEFFIANYRSDPRMPNVLGNIVRDQLTIGDYTGAVANSRVLVSLDPPAALDMQRTAWVTIANAEFDGKDYANAEKSYQKVLTFDGFTREQRVEYSKQVANSIYKNAESLQAKGELVPAAEEFLRLGQVMPASVIRPQAHFDAANLYLEAKEWDKAITTLIVFERLYPNHKLIETFPDKMAVAYKNTEQYDKAADQYIIIARRYEKTDKELARQTLWEAAELKEKAKNSVDANELYREYANSYPKPLEQNVEAQYKLVQHYTRENNDYRVSFWKDKIVKSHASAGDENTPRITFLAAEIKFEMVEPEYTRYRRIKITQPLKRSLERKKKQLELVLGQYQEIANMGSAEWTTASNHRIARIYQIMGEDLMTSERPKGLDADQLEQYDILIEEEAIPFEDRAIEVFSLNANLVNSNIYDKWVKESFSELAKLIPGRYAKFEKRAKYVESIN